jgi:3-hydroxybutyryl-CoA dehydrogenase
MPKSVVQGVLDRYKTSNSLKSAVEKADFVIEAVPEQVDLKLQLFRELTTLTCDHCILATNTSSISITQIAAAAESASSRVIGMHFMVSCQE